MSKQEAISMDSIKEKLKNLKEYMPDQEDVICDYAKLLADVLNPKLTPAGFHLASQLVLFDLQRGEDGINGTKSPDYSIIFQRLCGYPQIIHALIGMELPNIVKAVCPEDFAEEVIKECEKIKAFLQSKKAETN
jgi:hypothetical protein